MVVFGSNLKSLLDLTDDQFYDLCRAHPEVKFERSLAGHLIIGLFCKKSCVEILAME